MDARTGRFPTGFLFGTASAAHQIEGSNTNSDWWAFEHREGSGCADASGDACDSWHRWEEDLDLVRAIGLNSYRFSVEWARIEPAPGEFSTAALDHYRRVTEGCLERGLVPVVTLHHFTLPQWMAELGGFESPEIAPRMGDYAREVGSALGDLIGIACTVNEPNIVALMGFLLAAFPPGASDRARFEAVNETMRACHREMSGALRAGPGSYPVGFTLSMSEMEAEPGGEAQLAEALEHMEDAYLRDTAGDDFLGVQCYTRLRFGPSGPLDIPEGARRTKMGYEFRPEAVDHTVRRAAEATGLPIVVTETGISTDDDHERTEFLRVALEGVSGCIDDGLDVRGFFYWSLLDNFEWSRGYSQHFGLATCDRTTFERRLKRSALDYRSVATTRRMGALLGSHPGQ
jgi:beta-glucosidase